MWNHFPTAPPVSLSSQMFWLDVTAQMTRMKTVVVSGCHMMEQHWPQGTSEGLKSRCSGVENRWKWVLSEAEDWGKLLEDVLPEMTKFKVEGCKIIYY